MMEGTIEILPLLTLILGSKAGQIVEAVLALVGLASAVAKLTPTEKDNRYVDKALALVNFFALNPKSDKARK